MNDNLREFLNGIVSVLDDVDTHLINAEMDQATADANKAINRLKLLIVELKSIEK